MKQTHVDKGFPIWVKKPFLALCLVAAIVGVAVIPVSTYALVKEIFAMIGEAEDHAMPGLLGFVVFVVYGSVVLCTDFFGLAKTENW